MELAWTALVDSARAAKETDVREFETSRSAGLVGSDRLIVEDRQLVRAAALGDVTAWERIVDRHGPRVWSLAVHGTAREDEAVAVCEIVWRRLAQAVPELGREPLATWLDLVTAVECHRSRLRTGSERPHDRRRHPRAWSG